jgi:hypothetical protein
MSSKEKVVTINARHGRCASPATQPSRRLSDKRVLKLIWGFLNAGVMEDGLVLSFIGYWKGVG